MTKFEEALIAEIKRIRERAQQNMDWTDFDINISASGRVHSGEIDIVFACGSYSRVEANNMDSAILEYEHRKGFAKRNQPLSLSYNGEVVQD